MRKRVRANETVYRPAKKYKKAAFKLSEKTTRALMPSNTSTLIYGQFGSTVNPGIGGTCGVLVFSANGLYDPYITGIGAQPTGFDQLMVLYTEYMVTQAYIKCTFINNDSTNAQLVGIAVSTSATAKTDPREYVENGDCVWQGISVKGGLDKAMLTLDVDIAKFVKEKIFNESEYAGSASANPTNQVYFHIFGVCADGNTDSSTITTDVEIRYRSTLRDRSTAPVS